MHAHTQNAMQERKEHVNIIYPEEGKRYRLNVRTAVGRLTVGKVKQCLAAASTCPIPLEDMVLHLNGVPLSNDKDVCESLGIGNGATLSIEARTHEKGGYEGQQQQLSRVLSPRASAGHSCDLIRAGSEHGNYAHRSRGDVSPSLPFALSEQRRLLELQTLEQQDAMLHKDVVVRDDILKATLHHVDDEIDQANLRRRQLERQRENAEEELRRMHEKEAAAAQERERLAQLRAQETARATERAAQLAERREQLRAEQEATRAVALLKLENEKKKAALVQQKALLEAERERALLEQDSYEATTKARELELRSREIDLEHQRLARIREARALDADRRLAVKQRLHYYRRLGVEPPRALQREAAALLMGHCSSEEDDDDVGDTFGDGEKTLKGGSAKRSESRSKDTLKKRTVFTKNAEETETSGDGLVQSREPSHALSYPSPSPQRGSQIPTTAAQSQPPHKSPSPSSTQPAHSPSAPRHATDKANEEQINNDNINGTLTVPEGSFYDARENAEANLRRLGDDLGLADGLQFDDSDTCVISIDGEYTLLITYDAATERLYLYSTLLATLPPIVQNTAEGRLKLYEFLLEASLLGREMCGGGVGASMRNNFVLMSASLYMPTSQPWSLRSLAPQFLHCLQHWRTKLTEFLVALEQNGVGTSPPTTTAPAATTSPGGHTSTYSSMSAASSPAPRPSPGQRPTAPAASAAPHNTGNASPPWPGATAAAPKQQQHHHADPHKISSVSPSNCHPSSLSPSQPAFPPSEKASKVIPVLGLEVTGTVLVNGMLTHYDNGVLVVNAAGPSVLAGIQPNDFLEELNGVPIHSVQDFRRVIAEQLVPGMLVPVRINRGGVAMIVTVRVEAAWPL